MSLFRLVSAIVVMRGWWKWISQTLRNFERDTGPGRFSGITFLSENIRKALLEGLNQMEKMTMTKQDLLKELAKRAGEGRLAFFVGAGFSKAVMGKYTSGPCTGKDRALSWVDLLSEVAKYFALKDVIPYSKCKHPLDCPQIASEMVKELCEKRQDNNFHECDAMIKDYVCQLTNWYPQKDHKEGWLDIFDTIRPSVIITTNYDHVLESILEEKALSLSSTDVLPTSFDEDYLVYHIHGVRNRPDDIVLTREDYVEALRPFSYRQVRLTTLLSENSVLYLGYGRNDMNILSALDVARQTFSDVMSKNLGNMHVQVEYSDVGKNEVEELPSHNNLMMSYVIKIQDVKGFLNDLSNACKEHAEEVKRKYEFLKQLKSFVSPEDGRGNKKRFQQRRADIINTFENNVKAVNEPTKLGRKLASEFDAFIKEHYRDLFSKAHKQGNWEGYADMWSLLYAYFSMFSSQYVPNDKDTHKGPSPYMRRFGYALGWFNGLAHYIGNTPGTSIQAWNCFKKDWPMLPSRIKTIIVESATRSGYQQILDLLERAKVK